MEVKRLVGPFFFLVILCGFFRKTIYTHTHTHAHDWTDLAVNGFATAAS